MTTAVVAPAPVSRAAAHGVLWSYATFVVSKGLALVSTLVLARLLSPTDFGLIALALLFMGYLDILNDFGITSGVIWRSGDVDRTARVAYGLNLGIGALLSAAALVAAPAIAGLYDEPRLTKLLAVLAGTFLIASLGSVQDAILRRALAFRRRFAIESAKAVVKAAVTVATAAAGLGAWSVVYGQLAGVTAGAIGYWTLTRWRPGFSFDLRAARDLVGYGSQLTLLGLIAMAASSVDQLVVGRRLGAAELGFYALAFRLPGLLVMNTCSVVSQALFPAFARVRESEGALRGALLRALQTLAAVTVPLGIGMALVAPDLVHVLFGAEWARSVPVLRWLALDVVLMTLLYNDGDVYKATGRPSVLTALSALQLALTGPVVWWAAGHGITAAAASMAAVSAVVLAVRTHLIGRLLGVTLPELGRSLAPVAASVALMAITVAVVRAALADAPAALRLAAAVLVGATTYSAALLATARRSVHQVVALFRLAP